MMMYTRSPVGLVLLAVVSFRTTQSFVNVPRVERSALQSTSSSVAWEPAHVLTDAFSRNPFADDEASSAGAPMDYFADASSSNANAALGAATGPGPSENWLSQVLSGESLQRSRRQSSWLFKYIQSERARQQVQTSVKESLDNFLRDSGLLRSFMDFFVTIGVPALAIDNPEIVPRFIQLTQECTRIPYGEEEHWTQAFDTYGDRMQAIDMYMPETEKPRGLLFFVHGGAWGSGLPWMYRLLAHPFLQKGMAVAVVGYRTFPDGDMNDQVEDLEMAAEKLTQLYPELCTKESDYGVCMMGHSSGAHIAMSMVANRLQQKLRQQNQFTDEEGKMRIDSFIGLSAPYEIASHYEFETERGLKELSPMKAACGYDEECLSDYSPVLKLFQQMIKHPRQVCQEVNEVCPRIALIHGDDDDTVPFTSTRQAARLLSMAGISKCDELYLKETGHSDTVFHLMFGGETMDFISEWLERGSASKAGKGGENSETQTKAEQPEPSLAV